MKLRYLGVAAGVGCVAMLCVPTMAVAQTLGAAQSFAVEGQAGVTAAGGAGTIINGDVGSSPSASITGFPPAVVLLPYGLHFNDAAAIAAQAADVALFTELNTGPCTDTVGAQMSAVTFGPGVHCFSSTADLAASGVMTLSGNGLYIFRVGSALTANVLSTVSFAGVDACNVFWRVTDAATLNGVNFVGTVVAQAGVTLGVNAQLAGRALATVGPVTLSGVNTIGGCSALTPAPGGTGGSGSPVPTLPTVSIIGLTLLLGLTGLTVMRRRSN